MEITLDVFEVDDLKKLLKTNIAELERLVQYVPNNLSLNRLNDKIGRLKGVFWKLGGTNEN